MSIQGERDVALESGVIVLVVGWIARFGVPLIYYIIAKDAR